MSLIFWQDKAQGAHRAALTVQDPEAASRALGFGLEGSHHQPAWLSAPLDTALSSGLEWEGDCLTLSSTLWIYPKAYPQTVAVELGLWNKDLAVLRCSSAAAWVWPKCPKCAGLWRGRLVCHGEPEECV